MIITENPHFTSDMTAQLEKVYGAFTELVRVLTKNPDYKVAPHVATNNITMLANDIYSTGQPVYLPSVCYSEDGDPLYVEDGWYPKNIRKEVLAIKDEFLFLEALRRTGKINMLCARPFIEAMFPDDDVDTARGILIDWTDSYCRADYGSYEKEIAKHTEAIDKLFKEVRVE